jgi:hypothetical protein
VVDDGLLFDMGNGLLLSLRARTGP